MSYEAFRKNNLRDQSKNIKKLFFWWWWHLIKIYRVIKLTYVYLSHSLNFTTFLYLFFSLNQNNFFLLSVFLQSTVNIVYEEKACFTDVRKISTIHRLHLTPTRKASYLFFQCTNNSLFIFVVRKNFFYLFVL